MRTYLLPSRAPPVPEQPDRLPCLLPPLLIRVQVLHGHGDVPVAQLGAGGLQVGGPEQARPDRVPDSVQELAGLVDSGVLERLVEGLGRAGPALAAAPVALEDPVLGVIPYPFEETRS
jgi:hypothetical protein